MTQPWKRFLFLRFPVAVLGIALIAQALAWALSGVTMRRNRTDELVLSVLSDPTNYRVLLLADSITRNATARFALGPPGEIGNLATHAHFGMAGELLLLERYLTTHAAPQYVVMAFAPAMYQRVSDIRLVRYALWHTFRGQEEQKFLKSQFPDIDSRDWLPAAADLQVRVVEPFFSFLKAQYLTLRRKEAARIGAGHLDPNPNTPTTASKPMAGEVDRVVTEGLKTVDTPVNAEVLHRVCRLAEHYGFRVKLVWPPMAAELERALAGSGALAQLQQKMHATMAGHCQVEEVFDFNRVRTYTISSFHLDLIHLFGDGWEQRYASDLRRYLSELVDRSSSTEATQSPGMSRSP
jgi:hypothetical protein